MKDKVIMSVFIDSIAIILFLLMFLVFFVIIESTTLKVTDVNPNGNCYDDNGNKMNNITCNEILRCGIIQKTFFPNQCFFQLNNSEGE